MLNFKIQIANGLLIDINEPIGFNNVDFNLERSKTLHSISSNFAGNSIEFELNNKVHYNVFNNILTEYETEGFLTDTKPAVYEKVVVTYNFSGNNLNEEKLTRSVD